MSYEKKSIHKKQNEDKERIKQLELDLRNAQMNHHFVFNVLSSIEYFLLKKEPETAREYLRKFSSLIRLTLNNSRRMYISLEEDLCALKQYIELELFRLDHKHQFEINVCETIDTSALLTQPLLIQPFVENAIKHGLQHTHTTGHLLIKIQMSGNELHCRVEDNGAGRNKESIPLNNNCSGITITQERLKYMHDRFQSRYAFQIDDIQNKKGKPSGTCIQFNIPYVRRSNVNINDYSQR